MMPDLPKNAKSRRLQTSRAAFEDYAFTKGWQFSSSGWPTYMVSDQNEVFCVLVERDRDMKLNADQLQIMSILRKHDIRCYRFFADTNTFEEFQPDGSTSSLLM